MSYLACGMLTTVGNPGSYLCGSSIFNPLRTSRDGDDPRNARTRLAQKKGGCRCRLDYGLSGLTELDDFFHQSQMVAEEKFFNTREKGFPNCKWDMYLGKGRWHVYLHLKVVSKMSNLYK